MPQATLGRLFGRRPAPISPWNGELKKLPPAISEWLRCEQRLLSRAVDTSRLYPPSKTKQDKAYAPEAGNAFFVKSYWVDEDAAKGLVGEGLDPKLSALLTRVKDGRQQYRLLVHPESERHYAQLLGDAERAEDLLATSTASSRTLLMWRQDHEDAPFFGKVSLDKKIAGVTRTIPRGEVARSVGISNVLANDALTSGFDYLPEVFGLMPDGMARGGMIVRQIPDAVVQGEEQVVPLFSLYAKPEGGGPPLLARMITKSGEDPREFVRTRLIAPFVRQWFELAVERGITSEPHAQNLLLVLGADGLPDGSFVHRDLGGFNVDFGYRKTLGIADPSALPVLTDLVSDYHADKHEDTFTFLNTYFVGGFVYNVEKALAEWTKDGLVPGPEVKKGELEEMVREELSRLHEALTGESFGLFGRFDRVPELVKSARAFYLAHPIVPQAPKLEVVRSVVVERAPQTSGLVTPSSGSAAPR